MSGVLAASWQRRLVHSGGTAETSKAAPNQASSPSRWPSVLTWSRKAEAFNAWR